MKLGESKLTPFFVIVFCFNYIDIGIFMLIACEGLIGASKSTNSQSLVSCGVCDKYIPEPVQENPYLEEYYKDPKATSFKMQVFLLNARYKSFQKSQWESLLNPNTKIVADRSFYGDFAFARVQKEEGLMSDLDFQVYQDLHLTYQMSLLFPELVIYLRLTPEKAMERIAQRGRGCESGIQLTYMQDLYHAYEDLMDELAKKTQVAVIDASGTKEEVLNSCIKVVKDTEERIKNNRAEGRFAGYMGSFV